MNREEFKKELLERVILNMNYISSLTCEENKKLISEVIPKFDLTTRKSNLDTLSPEKLISLGKKWGWKEQGNVTLSQSNYLQQSSQQAKSYLLSIGYPKFGTPPNIKQEDLQKNIYYTSKQSYKPNPINKVEINGIAQKKYKDWGEMIRLRPEFKNCLSRIPKEFSTLPPEALEAFKSNEDFCLYNSSNYVERTEPMETPELDRVMENYRTILLSNVMIGVQLVLAFTKYGHAIDAMLWGVLVLYDYFKLSETKNLAYLSNLILDLLSIVSGGVIGKACKSFFNVTKTGMKQLFEKLAGTTVFPKIVEFSKKMISGSDGIPNILKSCRDYIVEKFGMKQADNWLDGAIKKYEELVKFFKTDFKLFLKKFSGGRLTAKVAKKVLSYPWVQEIVKKIPSFDSQLLKSMKTKSPTRFSAELGTMISKSEWSKILSFAETYYKDAPLEYALEKIDEKFGTKMALVFIYATSISKFGKSDAKTKDHIKAALTLDTAYGKKIKSGEKAYGAGQELFGDEES